MTNTLESHPPNVNLEGIQNLKALRKLDLGNTGIQTLKGVNELRGLQELRLNGSQRLNLGGVDRLTALRSLAIGRMGQSRINLPFPVHTAI